MHETIDFLIEHGYTVLFAWVGDSGSDPACAQRKRNSEIPRDREVILYCT